MANGHPRAKAKVHHLFDKWPAWHRYLIRIGAVEKNFRKAEILEYDREAYRRWRTIAVIKIGPAPDFAISSNNKDDNYKPTDEEAAGIKAELTANCPKSISANTIEKLLDKLGLKKNDGSLFLCPDQNRKAIDFVQQRTNNKKGDKVYLPWSLWNDNEWRMMEPDHVVGLPLWKPAKDRQKSRIMIHEGAKAASFIDDLVNNPERKAELAAHPWHDELVDYEHWGWLGGADRAHHVNWETISADHHLVLVCDNDPPGKDSITDISRTLRREMSVIMFDDKFPQAFDLADDWPRHPDWWDKDRYCGPTFDDRLFSATWATDSFKDGKTGRPSFKIRNQFAAEWLWSVKPEVFINRRQTNRWLTVTEFNRSVRPFSDSEDTGRLLNRKASSRVDGLAYLPSKDRYGKIVGVDGQMLINTFRPTNIRPMKGDPAPFIEFLDYLIPIKVDNLEVKRWIATLIARPQVRMLYSIPLVSEIQGVGKGTLGEHILAPLVGLWNTSFPSEQEVVDSRYNTWRAHKRLAVVHEIYSGQSRKAYDKLKSVVADGRFDVYTKYLSEYQLENFIHILACSNSTRALHLDIDDRRWLVPHVTDQKRPTEYWRDLHLWLRSGGLGIILKWAEDFLKEDPSRVVVAGARAPMSSTKKQVINESRSEGQQWAYDIAEIVKDMKDKAIIVVEDVRTHLKWERAEDRGTQWLEKPMTILSAMVSAGLQQPLPRDGEPRRRFLVHKMISSGISTTDRHYSYIVANFEIDQTAEWSDLKQYRKEPYKLMKEEI